MSTAWTDDLVWRATVEGPEINFCAGADLGLPGLTPSDFDRRLPFSCGAWCVFDSSNRGWALALAHDGTGACWSPVSDMNKHDCKQWQVQQTDVNAAHGAGHNDHPAKERSMLHSHAKTTASSSAKKPETSDSLPATSPAMSSRSSPQVPAKATTSAPKLSSDWLPHVALIKAVTDACHAHKAWDDAIWRSAVEAPRLCDGAMSDAPGVLCWTPLCFDPLRRTCVCFDLVSTLGPGYAG